ncbi:MAG: HAD-IB family hydrolase [Parachlamydiaceae bacterium]
MNTIDKPEKRIVAAFDFDGTMTKRDTLLPFLFFAAGKRATLRKLFKALPYFAGFLLKIISRQQAKEKILKSFFSGIPESQLKELGETFSQSPALKKLLLPQAMKRLEWHRRQNHLCVLVSASIDAYLTPWHKAAGFDRLICSELEIDPYGIVTGKLRGKNCWGPEKERRLLPVIFPRENAILYAYGDSRGDRELLALADHPFLNKMPTSQ